jgi:hypothetical protein
MKQIKNNYVPVGTKDKVFPSTKYCLMMAHLRPKHVAAINNKCT